MLERKDGKLYPTYAYAILTGCGALHVTTQCGVFKGSTKEIFVDRREYTGTLWTQIDDAYQFVLRNIHMGAYFEGIYRQDVYEIPPDAIRELIINAAVHRSYLDHGNIQVAIYDNRLEITSPGKIPMGQTYRRQAVNVNYLEQRTQSIAYADRVQEKDNGCRKSAVKMQESAVKMPINEQEKIVCQFIMENGFITTMKATEILGVKQRRARAILGKMVEKGCLRKEGASRNTVYIINTGKYHKN